jgi:hypothetical protein
VRNGISKIPLSSSLVLIDKLDRNNTVIRLKTMNMGLFKKSAELFLIDNQNNILKTWLIATLY